MGAHLDLDCYFAQAEQRRRPELVGRPVAVGHRGPRGIVTTASYEARACGVRTAMPVREAQRICPELVVLAPEFGYYAALSWEVAAAVAEHADELHRYGLDELWVPGRAPADAVAPWATAWARTLQRRVRERAGLTGAVGVAPTPIAAKLACARAKPGGVHVVVPAALDAFLDSHPLAAVPGIGPVGAGRLAAHELTTVAEARRAGPDRVAAALGARAGAVVWAHLTGAAAPEPAGPPGRSLGHERTLDADVTDPGAFAATVEAVLAEALARLWRSGFAARRVTVKLRSAGFTDHSVTRSLGAPTVAAPVIAAAVHGTLGALWARGGGAVRLVGVSFGGLTTAVQLSLEGGNSALLGVPPQAGEAVTHPVFGSGVVVCGDEEWAVVRFGAAVKVIGDPRRYLAGTPAG